MKRIHFGILSAVAFGLLTALPSVAQEAADPDLEWMIIFQGEVREVSDGRIVLAANPHGIAFTDRPDRLVALVETGELVDSAWGEDGDFRADPPNASLINQTRESIGVVIITDAKWSDGILELAVSILDGELPATDDHIALTVDSGTITGKFIR